MLRLLNKFADDVYRRHVGSASVVFHDDKTLVGVSRKNTGTLYSAFDSPQTVELPDERSVPAFRGALCRVALPDFQFYYHQMRFTQVPSKKVAVQRFLEWRLREELGELQANCSVAFGDISGKAGQCSALLIRANHKDEVSSMVEEMGGRVEQVSPLCSYILAHLVSASRHPSEAGEYFAVLMLWNNYWTFLLARENGSVAYIRSCRWLDKAPSKDEVNELQADCQRLIDYFVAESGDKNLIVLGNVRLCQGFGVAARRRGMVHHLQEECVFDEEDSTARERFLIDVVMKYEG